MKQRATRNRTLDCTPQEHRHFASKVTFADEYQPTSVSDLRDVTICGDCMTVLPLLLRKSVDLLILDPPYNLAKNFNGNQFLEKTASEYTSWFDQTLDLLTPLLKSDATIYVCADWKTSLLITSPLQSRFFVRNRITWEREKGRGAKRNWKNNTEDIWFCTVSEKYHFDVDAVKLKRKVIAPYRNRAGDPKDWQETAEGKCRLTYPSNVWTDLTVPFWSMPENTDHPTQKPEKLIAKLILASSRPDDLILDPFLGSGTTSVVAKKLRRNYVGVEINEEYCCWAEKRLELAEKDTNIQGISDGVFWERNSMK